jgi:hypothetical protein
VVLLRYDETGLTHSNTNTLTARTCLQGGGHGCVHIRSHGHACSADLDPLIALAHDDRHSYCCGGIVEPHGAGAIGLEAEATSCVWDC